MNNTSNSRKLIASKLKNVKSRQLIGREADVDNMSVEQLRMFCLLTVLRNNKLI